MFTLQTDKKILQEFKSFPCSYLLHIIFTNTKQNLLLRLIK